MDEPTASQASKSERSLQARPDPRKLNYHEQLDLVFVTWRLRQRLPEDDPERAQTKVPEEVWDRF